MNLKINSCHEFFFKRLVIDSTILSTDTLKNNLRELIGFQNKEFRLLMRASRDGFTDGAYHGRVDGAEQTLLVIKSDSDYIFGGYLEYMKDKGMSMFCLFKILKLTSIRLGLKSSLD